MNPKNAKRYSKFMSLVLRHQPELIGLELDEQGWASVDVLLAGMAKHGRRLTREQLTEVVANNDKKRFAFDETGERIRAHQGHSVRVELGYEPAIPPETLLHGTPANAVDSILKTGLERRARHHVHLHADHSVAEAVGRRRGAPVLLRIRAKAMHDAGHIFYQTPNDVWLTDEVPPEFLSLPDDE